MFTFILVALIFWHLLGVKDQLDRIDGQNQITHQHLTEIRSEVMHVNSILTGAEVVDHNNNYKEIHTKLNKITKTLDLAQTQGKHY